MADGELAAPPSLERSLSTALGIDATEVTLLHCDVKTLRLLKSVSHEWAQRARAVLCSPGWRSLQVRAEDSSLAAVGMSCTELFELLRTLRRDGIEVTELRCGERTVSLAELPTSIREWAKNP